MTQEAAVVLLSSLEAPQGRAAAALQLPHDAPEDRPVLFGTTGLREALGDQARGVKNLLFNVMGSNAPSHFLQGEV